MNFRELLYEVAVDFHATGVRIAVIIFVLCTPFCILAQQNETLQAKEQEIPLEEVIVIGERAMLLNLRTQMMQAEVKAYEIFTKFNDEERFNISCVMNAPTGTRIKRQVCTANFELEATAVHGADFYQNYRDLLDPFTLEDSHPPQHEPAEQAIARQLADYKRKIRQVAEEHPEFLEAIIEYSERREQYEEARSSERKNN